MGDHSNPRKIIQVGNNLGVTLPNDKVSEWNINKGERYVLEPTEDGFRAREVEWEVTA